jgi:hypothetical protein
MESKLFIEVVTVDGDVMLLNKRYIVKAEPVETGIYTDIYLDTQVNQSNHYYYRITMTYTEFKKQLLT